MKQVGATLVLAFVPLTISGAGSATAAPAAPFAVVNVRVFDGGRVIPAATVVVRDGRIEAVDPGAKTPAGVQVIDGAGKTLLPGLIDAHVHTFGMARRDAIRFGVTTELDMFTDWHSLAELKRDRESMNNTALSDVFSAGTLVTVRGGHGTEYGLAIPTLDRTSNAAAFIDARIAEGSDFIKLVMEDNSQFGPGRALIPTLSDGSVRAAIAAAHARGKLAVVHVATQRDATTALEAGADGLAHVFEDVPASDEFVRLAKRRGAFVIATLSIVEMNEITGSAIALAEDARIGPALSAAQRATLMRPVERGGAGRFSANARESLRRLHSAGVPVLAGTDAGNPRTVHGASMHAELALLVDTGLTPIEALNAATGLPAERFGLRDRGRIAPGMRADLVLVEGDPTTAIAASRAIVAIWKNGSKVDRSTALPKSPNAPAQSQISHFDGGEIDASYGFGWQATTDQVIRGSSTAAMKLATGGANRTKGALEISGDIKPGAATLWGGAIFFAAANPGLTLDYTQKQTVVFQAQGDGRTYQVMLFTGENPAPSVQTFPGSSEWREQRLQLNEFKGADLGHLRAIAIVASGPAGSYRLLIDEFEVR